MNYVVINAPHIRTLETLVNLRMSEGWEAVGGLTWIQTEKKEHPVYCYTKDKGLHEISSPIETERHWFQAMILK